MGLCQFGARGICWEAQALWLISVLFISNFTPFISGSGPFGQWPPLVEVSKGFQRLWDGSGICVGNQLLKDLSLPFHGLLQFRLERSDGELGGRAGRSPSSAALKKRN